MAKAINDIIIDRQLYKAGEDIWDLGSWQCVRVTKSPNGGEIRHYEGVATDLSKLPHYVATGSSAYCLDNKKTYKFNKVTDQWYDVTESATTLLKSK